MSASLRLLREEPTTDKSIRALQEENESLREEVELLRRRDEALQMHMQRLDEELRLAARLQQDFLPPELPRVGLARFHALFRPAGYVSGDLYDVFRLDESHVGFYLADAIGHGVPAALLTMFLRTSLVSKEIFSRGYRLLTPGEALGRLNAALMAQSFSLTTFATAVYGVIDVESGEVTLSTAGHPCPTLVPGSGGEATDVQLARGALLGVFADEVYPTTKFTLARGDRLFLHSDGIEAVVGNIEDNDLRRAWRTELENRRAMETYDLLAEFSECLDRQSGSLQPKDDLTVIAVEMNRF